MVLIGLILLGVAVIALALVMILRPRQPGHARKAEELYAEGSERQVYERLYGKRSMTVSAPVPIERRAETERE